MQEVREIGFSLPSGSTCKMTAPMPYAEATAPIPYAEASAARVMGSFGS